MKKCLIVFALLLVLAAGLTYTFSQEQTDEEKAKQRMEERKKRIRPFTKEEVEEMRKMGRLPETVKGAREKGTEEEELQKVVKGVKDKELSPEEANQTVEMMKKNTEDGKSNQGMGQFIMEQRRKGLRGKELSRAIHEELARRKPHMTDKRKRAEVKKKKAEAAAAEKKSKEEVEKFKKEKMQKESKRKKMMKERREQRVKKEKQGEKDD